MIEVSSFDPAVLQAAIVGHEWRIWHFLPLLFIPSCRVLLKHLSARLVRSNLDVALNHLLRATLSLSAASDATGYVRLSGLEGLAAAGEQTMLNAVAGDFRTRINAGFLPDIVFVHRDGLG